MPLLRVRRDRWSLRRATTAVLTMLFPELYHEDDLHRFCEGCRYDCYEARIVEENQMARWDHMYTLPF